ncbi:MAG: cation transporter [Ignavibacteriaceae bacterium]|jgi:copper chaperone|nr:cation transporter [Ignavibacteriaceae bacterium]
MTTKEFTIEGMSCMHCVKAVEIELAKLDLVNSKVSIGKAEVTFDESKTSEELIKNAIEEAGYKVV